MDNSQHSATPAFVAPDAPDLTLRDVDKDPFDGFMVPAATPAQQELRDRGWTDIHCSRCGLVIGRVGLWDGQPMARTIQDFEVHYLLGQRIPLWCPRCHRRYDGHTPSSLLNRVRRRRCDVLGVPY